MRSIPFYPLPADDFHRKKGTDLFNSLQRQTPRHWQSCLPARSSLPRSGGGFQYKGKWLAVDDALHRRVDQKAAAGFAVGQRILVYPGENPAGDADIDPLGMVIKQHSIDLHHGPQPSGELRVLDMAGQRAGSGNRAAIVKHGLNPESDSLLAVFDRFIKSVAGGKTAGKIGDNNPERMGLVAGLYGDWIFNLHDMLLFYASLFQQLVHQPSPKVFLWMRNADMAGA